MIRGLKRALGAAVRLPGSGLAGADASPAAVSFVRFSAASNDIFPRYQACVDAKIEATASDALQMLPAAFERLHAGSTDREAVSHALQSCRRMIEAYADAVYPATTWTGDNWRSDLQHHKERYQGPVESLCGNKNVVGQPLCALGENLGSPWDRLLVAVHGEVERAEAQALVLNTYLLLGEITDLVP